MKYLTIFALCVFPYSVLGQAVLSQSEFREIRRSGDSGLLYDTIVDLILENEPSGVYSVNADQARILLQELREVDSTVSYDVETLALVAGGEISRASNRLENLKNRSWRNNILEKIAHVYIQRGANNDFISLHQANLSAALNSADASREQRISAAESAMALGNLFSDETQSEFDLNLALEYYKEAAYLGGVYGALNAARIIEQLEEYDYQSDGMNEVGFFKMAAITLPEAQLRLSQYYFEGRDGILQPDYERANYYLNRAVSQDYEEAEAYAATLLYDGLYGTELDVEAALALIKGNNSSAALDFLHSKASAGDADALNMIAAKYILNPNIDHSAFQLINDETVFRVSNSWMIFFSSFEIGTLFDAAKAGNVVAQNALGNALNMDAGGNMFNCNRGSGVCQERYDLDDRQMSPTYWLERAAEQNHPEGLYGYGMLFMDGVFVEEDRIRGTATILRSWHLGYENSSSVLNRELDEDLFDDLISLRSGEVDAALFAFMRRYDGGNETLFSEADQYFSNTEFGSISQSSPDTLPSGNVVEDLKELSELFNQGLLTEEEFNSAKALLLQN